MSLEEVSKRVAQNLPFEGLVEVGKLGHCEGPRY